MAAVKPRPQPQVVASEGAPHYLGFCERALNSKHIYIYMYVYSKNLYVRRGDVYVYSHSGPYTAIPSRNKTD